MLESVFFSHCAAVSRGAKSASALLVVRVKGLTVVAYEWGGVGGIS